MLDEVSYVVLNHTSGEYIPCEDREEVLQAIIDSITACINNEDYPNVEAYEGLTKENQIALALGQSIYYHDASYFCTILSADSELDFGDVLTDD